MRAPFEKLDSLCVNDWWNREPSPIVETRVPRVDVLAFGIYTVRARSLKLSAQLFPLYPAETRTVRLEFLRQGEWLEAAREQVNDMGWSALFRIDDWDSTHAVPYRLRHGEQAVYHGIEPAGLMQVILTRNGMEKLTIILPDHLAGRESKIRGSVMAREHELSYLVAAGFLGLELAFVDETYYRSWRKAQRLVDRRGEGNGAHN